MIMLSLTKIKNKPLLYVGGLLAVFIASLFASQVARADPLQPTYTLSYQAQISAKGGFISDPNVSSNVMFTKSGDAWKFGEPKSSYNEGYYNESTAEIYFKYERDPNLYITHTQFAIPGGIAANSEHGPCDVAIKLVDVSSQSGGTFVGVERNDDPSKQVEDPACTKAVLDQLTLGSNQVAFGNISEPTGETFMGVTIETCKKDDSDCKARRKEQIKQADAVIVCTTTSQDNIERCNYYKSIITCLKTSPSISVARCTTRANATRILDGNYSVITAETTDQYISDTCKTLENNSDRQQCIDKATKHRDKLKADKEKCEKDGGTWDSSTNRCTEAESTTSCSVEGVGWIVCPVMNFMGKLNDAAFGFISDFLKVEPKLLTDKDTAAAWSNFRDIANVAFVIAFLVIVYSQITGAGVSNYGIKRMLPRIIIAAVLVNLSYLMCQIAVDLSNIIGSSIYSFFKDMPTTDAISATSSDLPSWKKVIAFVLVGAAALVVGLLAITTISTAALLAFALIVLILIARKAALILLVVISPLAFVAYLLPNTEQWFKKWWKMFSSLLMVFPVVGVIFGASTLAARIINNAGGDPNESNYMLQITALGVMAVPLFAVPVVLKGALSAAGSVGNKLSGFADRAQGRAAKRTGERLNNRKERLGNRARATALGIGSNVSNSERFGRALGGKNSFRRRKLGALVSGGATSAADNEQKDKYAKIAAEAAARDYVAETAASSDSYARGLAGGKLTPGSADMARYVQSYAMQAKRKVEKEDIDAFRSQIVNLHPDPDKDSRSPNNFVNKMMNASSGAEKAAYAAEIAKRGSGPQFQEALEASRNIEDHEERRQVQSELLANMREDHFGVSDEMRGLLATGDLDQSFQIKDADGSVRKTAQGTDFKSAYDSSFDQRMERKMNASGIVSMKPHDMSVAKRLISDNELTDAALQRMVNSMAAAEQNENTKKEIKGETEAMFNAAKALAAQRGITVSTPTP